MGNGFSMSIADHNAIRTSPEIQAWVRQEAEQIAAAAGGLAGDPDGYETDMMVGTDRCRVRVRPRTPKARRAEAKTAPLMQIIASRGAG